MKVALALMARAPVAGQAKTRLAPALGEAGAAALAERLLRHAVAQAAATRLRPLTLWTTPDATHPVFAELQAAHGLALRVQGQADLGARMAQVFAAAFAEGADAVLLLGTDLPGLDTATLLAAAAALGTHDAVFVPALDGGYGLVGLRAPAPTLFAGMRWSHDRVMAHTRDRLAAAGLRHAELPPVADIDVPDDLRHLPAGWL